LIYDTGIIDEDCGLFKGTWITSCYFRDVADALIQFWDPTNMAFQNVTTNYGCAWLFFMPPQCDPAADIAAARPDGIMAQMDYSPVGFANPVIKLFGEPAGGCPPAGTGSCTFQFKRTHTFRVQPASVVATGHPNGNVVMALSSYAATSISYGGVGNQITCNAPGNWQLNYGSGLWVGTKSYGANPTGYYAKAGGSGPDCMIVV
jgi:hypothetical protein